MDRSAPKAAFQFERGRAIFFEIRSLFEVNVGILIFVDDEREVEARCDGRRRGNDDMKRATSATNDEEHVGARVQESMQFRVRESRPESEFFFLQFRQRNHKPRNSSSFPVLGKLCSTMILRYLRASSQAVINRSGGWRSFASSNFLPFAESQTFIQEQGLRSYTEFCVWKRQGLRPPYVPAHPSRIYRDDGWVSFSHWLGQEQEAQLPPEIKRDEKIITERAHAAAERKAFADYITKKRPDMELRPLWTGCNASHLFRIICAADADAADRWIPIQIRYSSEHKRQPGSYYVNHSADPDTGVIVVINGSRFVAGRRLEFGTSFRFRTADTFPAEDVFQVLEEWWSSSEAFPELDCVRALRMPSRTNRLLSDLLPVLNEAYFKQLRLSVAPHYDAKSPSIFLLGGKYRIWIRNATELSYNRLQISLFSARGVRSCTSEPAANADFLLVHLPEETLPPNGTNSGFPVFFLFPMSYLQTKGLVEGDGSRKKCTLYLYPPWKRERLTSTVDAKAEQLPFFVSDVSKLHEILRRYGNSAGFREVSAFGADVGYGSV